MKVTARPLGSFCVVDVAERRIDAAVAIAFKDAMRDLSDGVSGDVLLNLAQVDFIDSSGLGAIVAAMKHLGPDRRLHLVALGPAVEKVFRLTRMDSIFAIHPTLDAAVAGNDG